MTDQMSNEASHSVFNLLSIIPHVFVAGTIFFLAVTIVQNLKIHRRIFSFCEETDDPDILRELSASKRKLGLSIGIPVYLSPYFSSPFLYGIFKPRIVLPAAMEFTTEEYRQVFLHELTHYKRRDTWLKCLLIGINALHWFNPFAYMARRYIDRYCELSCDEQIVQTMNSTERRRYCELLLNVLWNAADQKVKLYSAFSDQRSYLERRINMILKNEGSKKKKSVRMLAIFLTVSLALVGTGVVYAGSEKEKGHIEDLTRFNLNTSSGDGAVTANGKGTVTFGTIQDGSRRVNILKEKGDGEISLSTRSSIAQFLDTLPKNALNSPDAKVAKSDVKNETSSSTQQISGNLNQGKGYNNKNLTLANGASISFTATWDTQQDFQVGIYSHETGETYYETLSGGSDSVTFDVLISGEYSIYVGNPASKTVRWSVSYSVN